MSPGPDTASAHAAANLRPLSLGELLDRAFSIYFKNIAAFSALIAVVLVPSTIISYLETRDIFDFLIQMVQHQIAAPTSTPDLTKLSTLQPAGALTAVQYALVFLGFPFAYGAVVAGVSRAYLGLPVRFGQAYRYALSRWLWIFILILIWVFAAVFIVAGAFVVLFLSVLGVGALGGLFGSSTFAGVTAAIVMVILVFGIIGFAVMLYLTWAISFIAVVIERVDPITAFGTAFARMFSGGQFWRGFVLALALAGINLGAELVTGGTGALLAYFMKSPALYLISIGLNSLFFTPFAIIAAAVFYYDIRIRREGYDLQLLLDAFAQPAPSASAGP